MALRTIVTRGDEILGKRAREIGEITAHICMTLDDMAETMREQDGVGIAAPQVGVLRRMFIVEVDDVYIELINPEIIQMDGSQTDEEGCLSVPGIVGTVERPEYVKIKGLNRHGEEVVYEGRDLLARAFSHEFDHLEGVLFVEKATDIRELE
ncbi:MAG: peptide deformylase [Anaerovorax sp.]